MNVQDVGLCVSVKLAAFSFGKLMMKNPAWRMVWRKENYIAVIRDKYPTTSPMRLSVVSRFRQSCECAICLHAISSQVIGPNSSHADTYANPMPDQKQQKTRI